MYLRIILPILLCLASSAMLVAQDQPVYNPIATAHFQDGQANLLAKDYRAAIRHFGKALQVQPTLTVARRLIGQCHALLREYPQAANQYLQVIKADSLYSRLIYYDLGDVYYKMNEPGLALTYFEAFKRMQDYPAEMFGLHGVEEMADELLHIDRLPNIIRACQLTVDSTKFINITEILNLGPGINSKQDDYFPFLTNDQQQIYFTRQGETRDEDLYYSQLKGGQWRTASKIKDFNTAAPEGMSTLVRNGRQMFFTACLRDSVEGPCDIWEAIVQGDKITGVTPLGIPLNTSHWESQATVSCDGSRLFFASNRPGGVGGTDIYMTERQPDGSWGIPVNLGEPLNTPGDEEAPFISNDGQTLYFSSTGHLGLGEQDVFMSWWDTRLARWSVPINLGPPVNGPHRELGFYLSADGRSGMFASDRPGGYGGMDIYRFQLSEQLYGEPITFVEGTVRDSVLRTGVHTVVTMNGSTMFPTDGQGRFFICAGAEETLDFRVSADDYHPYHNAFLIPNWDNRVFYTLDLLLRPEFSFLEELEAEVEPAPANRTRRDQPKELVVEHSLLFDFDSGTINEMEVRRLEALVASLQQLKVVKVEIIGYADDIGKATYNLQLSEERAKNTAVFLLTRSISVNDIHIQGKGSVVNDRERSQNRRVDIRITVLE